MLKDTIIQSFKELLTNRHLTVLSTILVLLALSFMVYIVVAVKPSELQLVVRYTAYGVTHIYREQWFYLLSFAAFSLAVAFFHIALAIKTYITKGHQLAVMILWLGIGIVILAWVTSFALINVWSPL